MTEGLSSFAQLTQRQYSTYFSCQSLLTTDPSIWQDNEAYQAAQKTIKGLIKGLAVVNDRAE